MMITWYLSSLLISLISVNSRLACCNCCTNAIAGNNLQHLMYVMPALDGRAIKIIVNANWLLKRQPQLLNAVINVYKVEWEKLDSSQYEVIQGKLNR
jgi:hypothetical protein